MRTAHELDRFIQNPAGVGELAHLNRHVGAARDEEQRMMAERHDHRAGFTHVEIFFAVQPAMFARRDVERERVFPLQHDAISARVYPAFFRILSDHQVVGADVASAVELMPARDRKGFEIDILLDAVLEDRRVFHVLGFDGLKVSDFLPPGLNELRYADMRIIAHRQSEALDAVDLAAENLHVPARVGNVFEEQRRRMLVALENHFDEPAHILVPGNARDAAQLADLFDFV